MNHRYDNDDDDIKREQESALGRVLKQEHSTSSGRGKKRDARGDLFAQLAEQFVHQVKAMASIDEKFKQEAKKEQQYDDDDVILIEADNSEPISKSENDNRIVERTVRLSGIPNRAANRVAQVLKHEFGITVFKAERHEASNPNDSDMEYPIDAASDSDADESSGNYGLRERNTKSSYSGDCFASMNHLACSSESSDSVGSKSDLPLPNSSPTRHQTSLITKNRALAAQKLVKRARSRLPQGLSSPEQSDLSHTEAAPESTASASNLPDDDLWDETIEEIYQRSKEIAIFSKNLMFHFFSASELTKCHTVYARVPFHNYRPGMTRRPLDPTRVNMIRQLVQRKAGPSSKIWTKCVCAMNRHITKVKVVGTKPKLLAKIDKNGRFKGTLFSKQNPRLKRSPLYEKNGLSFEEISRVYERARSMPNFAMNLMGFLFTESELRKCYNVYGRTNQRVSKPRLDARRVELIRRIVTENCTYDSRPLWSTCIFEMNRYITKLKLE